MDFPRIYFRLLKLKNHMEKTERAILSEHSLTRNDTLVISAIDESGKTLAELCDLCCIDKSTITKITKKLETDGYIRKATNCARGYKVYLTDQGKLLNRKAYETFSHLQEASVGFLTEEEMAILASLLEKILRVSETVMSQKIIEVMKE